MNAIVSVTKDWAIGNEGRLLVRNREDMRFFKETTMGGTVICGRTTFESFPGGALPGRRNIVLSRNTSYAPADAEVVRSIDEALQLVANVDPNTVWLIGGARVYEALLPHCSRALVTWNNTSMPADAYFPNLDKDDCWHLANTLGTGTTPSGIPFEFREYLHM